MPIHVAGHAFAYYHSHDVTMAYLGLDTTITSNSLLWKAMYFLFSQARIQWNVKNSFCVSTKPWREIASVIENNRSSLKLTSIQEWNKKKHNVSRPIQYTGVGKQLMKWSTSLTFPFCSKDKISLLTKTDLQLLYTQNSVSVVVDTFGFVPCTYNLCMDLFQLPLCSCISRTHTMHPT